MILLCTRQYSTRDRCTTAMLSLMRHGHVYIVSRFGVIRYVIVNSCVLLKRKSPRKRTTEHMLRYAAVHIQRSFWCVCFGARRRVTPHVTPWRAGDKLRRQPDELGRAKPQLRGQGLVLRLLGDHRVREAYVCSRQGQSGRLFSAATDLPRLTGCWPRRASG